MAPDLPRPDGPVALRFEWWAASVIVQRPAGSIGPCGTLPARAVGDDVAGARPADRRSGSYPYQHTGETIDPRTIVCRIVYGVGDRKTTP